jgi:hypothetical protein
MKTKNGRVFIGLAGFTEPVDCAPANNGLKRRRIVRRGEFRLPPGFAQITIKSIFPTRDGTLRVKKMFCHTACNREGN